MVQRTYKEMRHELIVEKAIIYNGDIIIPQQNLREVLKGIHDDVHCDTSVTQRRLKLQAWWPGYLRDVKDYGRRCIKCAVIKTSGKTKFTHGLKKKNHGVRYIWIVPMLKM